jgi:hypothetical protein
MIKYTYKLSTEPKIISDLRNQNNTTTTLFESLLNWELVLFT